MYRIHSDATDTLPAFDAVGENEENAVRIFEVMLNAHCLIASRGDHRVDGHSTFRNYGEQVTYTLVLDLTSKDVATLAEYMREVYEVLIVAEEV